MAKNNLQTLEIIKTIMKIPLVTINRLILVSLLVISVLMTLIFVLVASKVLQLSIRCLESASNYDYLHLTFK